MWENGIVSSLHQHHPRVAFVQHIDNIYLLSLQHLQEFWEIESLYFVVSFSWSIYEAKNIIEHFKPSNLWILFCTWKYIGSSFNSPLFTTFLVSVRQSSTTHEAQCKWSKSLHLWTSHMLIYPRWFWGKVLLTTNWSFRVLEDVY